MKRGEIWILEFPTRNGREQKGIRPSLIVADTRMNLIVADTRMNLIFAIPLTSNFQALRFPNTIEIKKSEFNKLEKDSVALVFQLQVLDRKRFIAKIGEMENQYIEKVSENLKKMLEL